MDKIVNCLLIFFLLVLTSCSSNQGRGYDVANWKASKANLKILCTTGMINDLVQQIGGENVSTIPLIIGDLDPHSYEPVKGDDELFHYADLVFYNGLGLEHGPSLAQLLSSEKNAYALGNIIFDNFPQDIIWTSDGVVDPHIWMDMSLWARCIPVIVEQLSKASPCNAEEFKFSGEYLLQDLQKKHNEYRELLQSIPQKKRFLVTSHDAFHYFTRAYLSEEEEVKQGTWMNRCQAPEGLAPESQLSGFDIERVVLHLVKYHIGVIFPESNVSSDALKKIIDSCARKQLEITLAKDPLFGDSMGEKGSPESSYKGMLEHNVQVIYSYLKK
jgi:manganese/zinc/iron transport system substrate-binding protein